MGPVQQLDDLAVDAARGDADLVPPAPLLLRRSQGRDEGTLLKPELRPHLRAEVGGDLRRRAIAPGDAPLLSERRKLLGVRDGIPGGRAVLADVPENPSDLATVVAMGSRARGDCPGQVARHDQMGVRAAGPHLRPLAERIDAAGPHVADIAAQPQIAEPAKGL
jgi:hypothetical protein